MSRTDPIADAAAVGIPPVRIEIISALRKGPAIVSQIETATGYTRNGLMSHLALLEKAGAVTASVERVDGSARPARRFRLNHERVEAIAWSLYDAFAEPEAYPVTDPDVKELPV